MIIRAGERLLLSDPDSFIAVNSGLVEVYAVSRGKTSFRQMFLIKLCPGEAAYPSLDEFGLLDIMLYAVEDTELVEKNFMAIEPHEQAGLCRIWFNKLAELSWIRILADKGDDVLTLWHTDSLLRAYEHSSQALRDEFVEHETIFSMILGVQFKFEDKRFLQQIDQRNRRRAVLIAESIANLTGENAEIPAGALDGRGDEEAVFLVERIAEALSMPKRDLSLSPDVTKKLDQLGIIRRMIQKGRMQMRLISLEKGWHKKDSGVILGYRGKDKHLAAFLPKSTDTYFLVDKEYPAGTLLTDELTEEIDNNAFACYAGLEAKVITPWDFSKFILKRCWFKDFKSIILASLIASIVALTLPVVTETVFKDIVPISDVARLATVTQISVFAAFSTLAIGLVRSVAIFRISSQVDMTAESAMLGRLFSLPTQFFRRFPSGELVGKLMSMLQIKTVMGGNTIPGVFDAVFSIFTFALMCYYSIKLSIIALGMWGIYAFLVTLISYRSVQYEESRVAAKNKTAGIVQQIFTGLAKFRLQGAEAQAFYLWSKAFGEEWSWNLKMRWLANYRSVLGAIQPIIVTLVFYFVVTNDMQEAVKQGKDPFAQLSYAQFVAFLTAFTGFNATLNNSIALVVSLLTLRPHVDNLKTILQEIPEATDDRIEAGVLSGRIELEHLTFAYSKETPDVLHDLNLQVKAGEHLAIVGKSGCGKSTLIRLLLGFEKPKSGSIFYDGHDLGETNLASVRMQMGVVLQNGQLMTGDIFTNIVGTAALSMDDAWAAAEAAGIADDIRAMPMGMHTVLSEGSGNISGGQRQRIMIARALAGRPAIIIFDEATSALDNRTQAIVTESLKKMKCTRVVVAHRLSTIKDADRIVVLDKGRIAESGTFSELVAKGGIFATLAQRQMA